jgi:hypothetical protein
MRIVVPKPHVEYSLSAGRLSFGFEELAELGWCGAKFVIGTKLHVHCSASSEVI